MPSSAARILGLALATLTAGNTLALGLGEAVGQAVLGQPLHIEIPLFGSGATTPSPDCFRVRPPVADLGGDFALRNARIQVVGERGGSKLIVSSHTLIREPVVGFAITAGCGFELTKDYLLLAALPGDAPAGVVAPSPPSPSPPLASAAAVVPSVAPAKLAQQAAVAPRLAPPAGPRPSSPVPAGTAENMLRIEADVTLEALAMQKYPAQPKAREKFVRMMTQANPGLPSNDGTIAAGTELRLPPGLPQRRIGPYLGEAKPAPPQPAVESVPPPAPRAEKPARPAKDRLVLGAAPESSPAKLLEETERLTALLAEQGKAQDALTENIAKLEGSYADLQRRYAQMEDRLNRIETERLAEKQAQNPASFDFFELLVAVLAGGAIGGMLLHLYQRQQLRRNGDAAAASSIPEPVPATSDLPWAAPVAAAAAGATEAALALVHTPASATEAAPAPAPASPVGEATAPEADDLDSLSLEFPLRPEPAAPAPDAAVPDAPSAQEPAPAAAMSLEFLLPPAEPPSGEAAPLVPGVAAPSVAGGETLSLDFPEIQLPGAGKPEIPHVIEFTSAAADAVDLPKLP